MATLWAGDEKCIFHDWRRHNFRGYRLPRELLKAIEPGPHIGSSSLFWAAVLTWINAGHMSVIYNILIYRNMLVFCKRRHMSIRRPSHLKEDLVIAFLTVLAVTIVMVL